MKPEFNPDAPPSAADPIPTSGIGRGIELLKRRIRRTGAQPSPEDRAEIGAAETALSASLTPATPNEISDAIVALLRHYPTRSHSETAAESVLRDWTSDLGRYPADIVAAACQQWRRQPHEYAPTPGQLLAIAEPIRRMREFYLTIARRELGGEADQQPKRKTG